MQRTQIGWKDGKGWVLHMYARQQPSAGPHTPSHKDRIYVTPMGVGVARLKGREIKG